VRPDRWETVNYWANFKGKATYFVERVLLAEHSPEFKRAFEASARRRRLAPGAGRHRHYPGVRG